ncbi:hypothetical protein JMJ55_16990 [Belnapia sp. T6]|uniref:Uncharacterized protein n=1 Tax=Belnapia mucosa TaxID=2804532 RepID=A0ABS1V5R9_9PROT|nr:hypothetical protein [Belnapia mucosa]MBL6457034.1 hypothetical protein [Belnapia mucosa]
MSAPRRLAAILLGLLALAACQSRQPATRAGEALDRAGSQTGQALGRAANSTGNALERAGGWMQRRTQ